MMAQMPSPRIERIAYQIWWLIEDRAERMHPGGYGDVHRRFGAVLLPNLPLSRLDRTLSQDGAQSCH